MRIAYIAAGAAGMYCGSCLHDNTLAAAMLKMGEQVQLIPTYTPLRTDEVDVSLDRIFFGGINVYLQQKSAFFRHTPWWLDRIFDRPKLIERLAGRASSVDAVQLADLTLSMLEGLNGHQKKEIDKLVAWFKSDGIPDVIHLSNTMLSGMASAFVDELGVPVVCSLAGEDIFLDKLPVDASEHAYRLIEQNSGSVAAFVALSTYYAETMRERLNLPVEKLHVIPHGLELSDFHQYPAEPFKSDRNSHDANERTIGYLARICHDKGLHLLVEAMEILLSDAKPQHQNLKLVAAGYLGGGDRNYLNKIEERVASGPLNGKFEYVGEVDRGQKLEFLHRMDIFSTPTIYQESKGLPALEALACARPCLLPDHGSFPEIIEKTKGGLLFKAGDANDLAEKLSWMLANEAESIALGRLGREAIERDYTAREMAERTLALYKSLK